MKTYVLFHAGCWDGLASAWCARRFLQDRVPDVIYQPVQYDSPAPELEPGSRLLLLDFCYPLEQLMAWWKGARAMKFLTIIDHHKTHEEIIAQFIKQLEGPDSRLRLVFNGNRSAAPLAWIHFFEQEPVPGMIQYIEDRDLWAWKMTGSREVCACLRSYPLAFETLDKYSLMTYQQIYMEMFSPGEAILRREKQIIDSHLRFASEMEIAGHKVLCTNATVLTSEIAGALAKGRPFGACYFDSKEGKRIWSLRSTAEGIDVSEVAKKFGGGGHKHAAGFSAPIKVEGDPYP